MKGNGGERKRIQVQPMGRRKQVKSNKMADKHIVKTRQESVNKKSKTGANPKSA